MRREKTLLESMEDKVKSVNKSYAGSLVGWNVWVDDNSKPYFKNTLTRQEAIDLVLKGL